MISRSNVTLTVVRTQKFKIPFIVSLHDILLQQKLMGFDLFWRLTQILCSLVKVYFGLNKKILLFEIQNTIFRMIIFGLSKYGCTYYNHCLINTNVFYVQSQRKGNDLLSNNRKLCYSLQHKVGISYSILLQSLMLYTHSQNTRGFTQYFSTFILKGNSKLYT